MPVPTSQHKKQEAAIAQNKQSLREAEESRLVSSWLKASLKSTTTTTNQSQPSININQEQIQDDDESDFSANEEGDSGLGFIAPKTTGDNILDRQHLSANDKLRRQMLGKNAFKSKLTASKPLPPQSRRAQRGDDSEDETEGRTKVAGKKSNSNLRTQVSTTRTMSEDVIDDTGNEVVDALGNTTVISTTKTLSRRRPASYLDEMLAKRSAKRSRAPQQPQARKAKKSDREDD